MSVALDGVPTANAHTRVRSDVISGSGHGHPQHTRTLSIGTSGKNTAMKSFLSSIGGVDLVSINVLSYACATPEQLKLLMQRQPVEFAAMVPNAMIRMKIAKAVQAKVPSRVLPPSHFHVYYGDGEETAKQINQRHDEAKQHTDAPTAGGHGKCDGYPAMTFGERSTATHSTGGLTQSSAGAAASASANDTGAAVAGGGTTAVVTITEGASDPSAATPATTQANAAGAKKDGKKEEPEARPDRYTTVWGKRVRRKGTKKIRIVKNSTAKAEKDGGNGGERGSEAKDTSTPPWIDKHDDRFYFTGVNGDDEDSIVMSPTNDEEASYQHDEAGCSVDEHGNMSIRGNGSVSSINRVPSRRRTGGGGSNCGGTTQDYGGGFVAISRPTATIINNQSTNMSSANPLDNIQQIEYHNPFDDSNAILHTPVDSFDGGSFNLIVIDDASNAGSTRSRGRLGLRSRPDAGTAMVAIDAPDAGPAAMENSTSVVHGVVPSTGAIRFSTMDGPNTIIGIKTTYKEVEAASRLSLGSLGIMGFEVGTGRAVLGGIILEYTSGHKALDFHPKRTLALEILDYTSSVLMFVAAVLAVVAAFVPYYEGHNVVWRSLQGTYKSGPIERVRYEKIGACSTAYSIFSGVCAGLVISAAFMLGFVGYFSLVAKPAMMVLVLPIIVWVLGIAAIHLINSYIPSMDNMCGFSPALRKAPDYKMLIGSDLLLVDFIIFVVAHVMRLIHEWCRHSIADSVPIAAPVELSRLSISTLEEVIRTKATTINPAAMPSWVNTAQPLFSLEPRSQRTAEGTGAAVVATTADGANDAPANTTVAEDAATPDRGAPVEYPTMDEGEAVTTTSRGGGVASPDATIPRPIGPLP